MNTDSRGICLRHSIGLLCIPFHDQGLYSRSVDTWGFRSSWSCRHEVNQGRIHLGSLEACDVFSKYPISNQGRQIQLHALPIQERSSEEKSLSKYSYGSGGLWTLVCDLVTFHTIKYSERLQIIGLKIS